MNFVVGYYAGRDSANQESGYEINKLKRENNRLKEQLLEANNIIRCYQKYEKLISFSSGTKNESLTQKYIEKWGIE